MNIASRATTSIPICPNICSSFPEPGKRNERGSLCENLPRPLLMMLLPDVNLDSIGLAAIRVQQHIDGATAGQAARDAQVELIQTFISALWPGVERRCLHVAEFDCHRREAALMAESRAVENQEYLFVFRAEVYRQHDEPVLRGVVLRDWLVASRAVRPDAQHVCGGDALAAPVRREQTRRDVGDIDHAG